jgi:Protein of unknown function (DUF998)
MVVAWLVAETLQPPSYSPLRSSISGLAALGGTDRWIMTSALVTVGACYFVTAACLPALRVPARIALVITGVCSRRQSAPQPVHGSSPQHLCWTSLGAVASLHRDPGPAEIAVRRDRPQRKIKVRNERSNSVFRTDRCAAGARVARFLSRVARCRQPTTQRWKRGRRQWDHGTVRDIPDFDLCYSAAMRSSSGWVNMVTPPVAKVATSAPAFPISGERRPAR